MPSFEVKIAANTPGLTLKNGHDVMIVEAADAADAAAMAAGHFDGDGNAAWSNAVATEVVVGTDLSPVVNDAGTTTAYKLRVTIEGDDLNQTYEYEAIAADTYAGVFTAMAAVLNADPVIAGAGFAADVLTISDIADDLGDHTVTAEFTYGGVAVPSFLGAVTDGGIAAATLEIATNAAVVLPAVLSSARS